MVSKEESSFLIPKLLVTIVDRDNSERVAEIMQEKHIHFQYTFHAMGTASSEILKTFGLSGTKKSICLCMIPSYKASRLMTAVKERMGLVKPGNGIAFIISISSISAYISSAFFKDFNEHSERLMESMEHEIEKHKHEARFELVAVIINQGYSDAVMSAARLAGAKGGTIINARRTGIEESVKFFGISLQAEKEIVAIVVPKEQKSELMHSITKFCGIKTDAKGLIFSLPVDDCAGIVLEEDEQL